MRRNNLFEVLFDQLNREVAREARRRDHTGARIAETSPYDPREYDGYRQEYVDGELTEYVLDDGEWQKIGVESGDEVSVSIGEHEDESGDGPIATATVDLSSRISDRYGAVAEVSFNNGILDVEFTAGSDEQSESDEE